MPTRTWTKTTQPISHKPPTSPHLAKTEDRISHACMTSGSGPFFSNPLSSHDINLGLLSLVFAMTTQSLGSPCHALVGCLSEMCQWKNELCTLARKESSSSENQPLLPFLSSHVCCRRNSSPHEITMDVYLHQE